MQGRFSDIKNLPLNLVTEDIISMTHQRQCFSGAFWISLISVFKVNDM